MEKWEQEYRERTSKNFPIELVSMDLQSEINRSIDKALGGKQERYWPSFYVTDIENVKESKYRSLYSNRKAIVYLVTFNHKGKPHSTFFNEGDCTFGLVENVRRTAGIQEKPKGWARFKALIAGI